MPALPFFTTTRTTSSATKWLALRMVGLAGRLCRWGREGSGHTPAACSGAVQWRRRGAQLPGAPARRPACGWCRGGVQARASRGQPAARHRCRHLLAP